VILRGGDPVEIKQEASLVQVLSEMKKALTGQDLIDAIRAMDAAGMITGKVETK
jgi:hypothetical protein